MSAAASGVTLLPARVYTASLPYLLTSFAVSSALDKTFFSLSDRCVLCLERIFLMSSSETANAARVFDPHSGHSIVAGISLTLFISTYFQQFVQTMVLTSLRILAFADPTRIWPSFSVGIKSVFRLILSRPILAIGVASPATVLTTLIWISCLAIDCRTSFVWGMSMSLSKVSRTASSMMTVPSKLFASWRSVMLLKSVHLEIAPNLLATWTSLRLNNPVLFDAVIATSSTSISESRRTIFTTSFASTPPTAWKTIL